MPDTKHFSIAQLSAQFDVSPRTLRFYEERGFLHPIRIGSSRYYTLHDKTRLEIVLRGRRLGFSLLEIWRIAFDNNNSCIEPMSDLSMMVGKQEIVKKLQNLCDKRDAIDRALEELNKALNAQSADTVVTPLKLTGSAENGSV